MKGEIEYYNPDKDDKRKKEGEKVDGYSIAYYSTTQKEIILLLCRTRLGTVHILYPLIGISDISSRERRGG